MLDFNKIESHVVFPSLPLLEILWINCNSISNLSIFIENVVNAFPCLRHLSMMNNEAAPSYFNGGSVEEYKDYRCVYIVFVSVCGAGALLDNMNKWLEHQDCWLKEKHSMFNV